jgi:hypothetical protein
MTCRHCGNAIWVDRRWLRGWRDAGGNVCSKDGYWHTPKLS